MIYPHRHKHHTAVVHSTGTYAVVDAVHEILKFLLASFCRAWPALHPQCALFQFRLQGTAMMVAALLIKLAKREDMIYI